MELNEYLETVSEQIRYKKIRSSVTKELKEHILDEAAHYEELGAFPEEALERAVREMGDPVSVGVSMDRIHRPHMNRGIVAMIAMISFFRIGIFYLADLASPDVAPWEFQAIFTLTGFLLMLAVYRLDYSILEHFRWKAAVGFLAVLFLWHISFHRSIYGTNRYLVFGSFVFSVSELMFLYVPLFCAALYSFRGNGKVVLMKVFSLLIVPVVFLLRLPDLSSAMLLFTCLFCCFLFAVWKNWYRIDRKLTLILSCGTVLLTPAALIGYLYFFGRAYQKDRILYFFTGKGDLSYYMENVQKLFESSSFLGTGETSLQLFTSGPVNEYLTDYILVSMCSFYGIFLTIAIIAALIFLILKIFKISIRQKNQLGMIVGIGCGLVFFLKTLLGILVNLHLVPYVGISIPFLSYGGTAAIVNYLLLGLVLSIYRYKNLLPANAEQRRRLRLLQYTPHK